jgi:hypothetical protein
VEPYEPTPLDQLSSQREVGRTTRDRVGRAFAPSDSLTGRALTVLGYVIVAALVVLVISWFV